MPRDREIVLSRRAKFVAAALAATGLAVAGGTSHEPAEKDAFAQPSPPPPSPRVCLDVAYDPGDDAEEARSRGDLARELAIYKERHRADPRAATMVDIANVLGRMRDWAGAHDAYAAALRLPQAPGRPIRKEAIEASMREAEAHTGKVRVLGKEQPRAAMIDGGGIDPAQLVMGRVANEGRHTLTLVFATSSVDRVIFITVGSMTELVLDAPIETTGPQTCLSIAPPAVTVDEIPKTRPPSGCGCSVAGKG